MEAFLAIFLISEFFSCFLVLNWLQYGYNLVKKRKQTQHYNCISGGIYSL